MKLGYDYLIVETNDLVSFLKKVKQQKLIILNLKQIDQNLYSFYTPIYQRYLLKRLNLKSTKSIGVLHYLLLLIHFPHFIFTLAFIISLIIYPNYIYHYQIEGNNPQLNKQLTNYLQKQVPYLHQSLTYQEINDLYDKIKDNYGNKIDYLNIYQNGGIVHLKYTKAIHNKKQVLNYQDYVAKKDGVISKIAVKKGNVMVKVNQYVQKGDLLISRLIEGTDDKTKIIATSGKIYAYTYQRYKVTMPLNDLTKDDNFAYLLFKLRTKLPKVKIEAEKVVSYAIIDNKLVLEMQYIFLENIAIKE